MTTIPKWNDERTAALVAIVEGENPITRATVATAAAELETTDRSIASKLRKLGYEVESVASAAPRFTAEEADALRAFVEANAGNLTYGEIAENFAGGKFTAKQVQGKILSQELTGSVKATPKVEAAKKYSEADEAKVIQLIQEGAFVEDIAAALGREVTSIRGKALSLLRAGVIEAIPAQRTAKPSAVDPFDALGAEIGDLTVAEIAERTGRTDRGVKTTLTRRGIAAKDYDGAAKAAKKKAAE